MPHSLPIQGALNIVLIDVHSTKSLRSDTISVIGAPGAPLPKTLQFANKIVQIGRCLRLDKVSENRRKRDTGRSPVRMCLSASMCKVMGIPKRARLQLKVDGERWSLGPFLAIYAPSPKPQNKRIFGEQTKLFEDFTVLGKDHGVYVAVITPGFYGSREGWSYDQYSRSWKKVECPIPDVVIRRFRGPVNSDVEEDLEFFRQHGRLHTLPFSCSNKWNLYQWLKESSELRSHLPMTTLANDWKTVYRLAKKHKDVYVKPLAGAQGYSVYRLVSNGKELTATWEHSLLPKETDRNLNGFNPRTEIRKRVFRDGPAFAAFWRGTALKRCLVQETVRVPRTKDGRRFDFRWLIQMHPDLQVVARVARLGSPDCVTTNIHTGGQAVPAESVIEHIKGLNVTQALTKLDEIALRVAQTLLEQHGPFVEVGVDLALTPRGEVFVFEVNPTPGRRMLRDLPGTIRGMSLVYILEYAIKATGFDENPG